MITKEIITNFFEGKCDAGEVAIVQAWLAENPAKLKEYIGAEEWEDFQPDRVLAPDISDKLWNNIDKNTASPAVHFSYFRWMAVAASVLLVVGASWQFILKRQKTSIISAATVAIPRNVFNNTPQKKALTLSDGSAVELLPSSTLSYPENFTSLKRDVILNGEATFNIAKDVAKPFSVYSNSVLITVLGTRFTVNSYESNNATKVVLYEGRVMVKIIDSSSQDNKNEYYLIPGDVFIFKKSARILHLEKDKDDGYVFNNYPLDVVFDQLQIIYNEKIVYNKAELGNRSFIGKIDKKDSLYHILQSIALLNNFGLHKQGDSFVISN
ncbi:FecR domain-containing protein [Puia dinghuensis]|uniref:FecR domain-containing protein n=1 Tax=Puia dinghuensis TaxID=1792502 RepID=UPI0016645E18|nr:FecR domain-containing protein [Puia dinghuensis]